MSIPGRTKSKKNTADYIFASTMDVFDEPYKGSNKSPTFEFNLRDIVLGGGATIVLDKASFKGFSNNLKVAFTNVDKAQGQIPYMVAFKILMDSSDIVPVDTGALGRTAAIRRRNGGSSIGYEFGYIGRGIRNPKSGASTWEYGPEVHNNAVYKHIPPGKSHFFQTAIRRNAHLMTEYASKVFGSILSSKGDAIYARIAHGEVNARYARQQILQKIEARVADTQAKKKSNSKQRTMKEVPF